ATAVYGGSMSSADPAVPAPGAAPLAESIDAMGRLVTDVNPYSTTMFPLVTLNAVVSTYPQFALGDTTGYVRNSAIDPGGNLYLADWNWNRVLIYKTPFLKF